MPHPTVETNDPFHASVAFRREDFKGSGVTLHIYPDGTVVPSKKGFPTFKGEGATADEQGENDARWLDVQYIADWQASNEATYSSGDKRDKGKAKSGSSKGSSSKKHSSSGKHGATGSKGKGKAANSGGYEEDPDTKVLYRYTEDGVVVHLDPDSQREYYVDEQGRSVWL